MNIRTVAVVAFACLPAGAAPAQEQSYPIRQIELVVPFPAGGGADVGARMVAQIASESLGQPIVIQNKAGATGAIGSEYVARAAPDGYTLLFGACSAAASTSRRWCRAPSPGRTCACSVFLPRSDIPPLPTLRP
jgi:tripartite-type tricarboxylate transporter receptor subunit TctC